MASQSSALSRQPFGNQHPSIVYVYAATASPGGLLAGYGIAVVSGGLLFLRRDFHLNTALQGVAANIVLIGAIVGALCAGLVNDLFGRKKALQTAAVVFLVGTLFTSLASTFGIFLVGLGIGAATSTAPVYISVMAPSQLRGTPGSFNQFAITVGIALAYGIGVLFAQLGDGRRPMFLVAIIPSMLLFLRMQFVPETPRWLSRRGHSDEARASLGRLGRTPSQIDQELAEITASRLHAERETHPWRELTHPGIRLALVVGVGLAIFQQLIGINAIIYYALTIFQVAGFHAASSALFTASLIGIVNVLTTLFACLIVGRVGRRPLLLGGTVTMVISLGVLGSVFMFHLSNTGVFTLIVLFASIIAFALSFGIIFWVMAGEIFPSDVRAIGSSISTFANWTANFCISVTFLTLAELIGIGGAFLLYALFTILALFFNWVLVPETKGRSLEAIEYYWTHEGQWPEDVPSSRTEPAG